MNDFLEGRFGFAFADPWMLGWLVLIPLAWLWRRTRRLPALGVAHGSLFEGVPLTWRVRAHGVPTVLHSLGLLLALLALARPVTRERVPMAAEGLDIVLVLDLSSSMLERDMDDRGTRNRIDAAKEAARDFIEARVNDRIGIVTFALFPELRCPLTLDHGAALRILKEIESVRPRSEEDRTGIGLGLALAARVLRKSEARSKVIVLLSDGQENVLEVTPTDAAKLAKDFGVKVYTIGAGRGDRTFFGVQPIDFSELENVAEITGGAFFRAEDEGALTSTYAKIDELERTELRDPRFQLREKYAFVLAPGFALMIAAFLLRSTLFGEVPAG